MEKDLILKNYLSDDERFADLLNGYIFHGEQIVTKDMLNELDAQTAVGKSGMGYRDLLKKAAFGVNFVIIGIENQENIHYAMPARELLYDAGVYRKQMSKIGKSVKKRKGITSAEWLSGFTKNDHLSPVVTIVLYYGNEPWDGATKLSDMLDLKELPVNLRGMVNDYKINLLEVRKFADTKLFRTDLRQVFEFLRYAGDHEQLKKLVQGDPNYQAMEEDAYEVISAYTNDTRIFKMKQFYEEGGKINMCKAIDDLIEEGKKQGIEQGIEQGVEL